MSSQELMERLIKEYFRHAPQRDLQDQVKSKDK